MSDLNQQLTAFIDKIDSIPNNKKYWLIRTESGNYFESFNSFNYVAINYEDITYKKVYDLKKNSINEKNFKENLKLLVSKTYPERQSGLITNQILKFLYEIKKGDVIIIPSENSEFVSFGEILNNELLVHSESMFNSSGCNYTKRKAVKWLKTINRKQLDPYLFKTFQAHQAINNITNYASIIERSLGDFYKIDNEISLVFNVKKETNIKAKDLLYFGTDLLKLVEDFVDENNLDFDTSDIEVKINVNSEGKIQFLSNSGKNLLLLGLISLVIIGVNGGGLKIDRPEFKLDLTTNGLIISISDYLDKKQDREMKERLFNNAKSLEIKTPEDLIRLTKQFSENKDLPK
jgi:restriction system protein